MNSANGPESLPAPSSFDARADGLVIRAARPDDAARVARLLALRGISIDEALAQAPDMIGGLPVLMMALLPVAGRKGPGRDGAGAVGETAPGEESADDLLAPVALSGAFALPAQMHELLTDADAHDGAWMVSGVVVDPQARRRGIGRLLLSAVADAVASLGSGGLYAVVDGADHATLGLHMAVGFEELARMDSFGALTFEGRRGVLLRLASSAH